MTPKSHLSRYARLVVVALSVLAVTNSVGAQSSSRSFIERVDEVVLADTGEAHQLEPRVPIMYPLAERSAGQEAGFSVLYVIDTTGRVERSTISFTSGASREFYDAVCTYLRKARFTVVRRDSVPRRAFVIEPISFGIQGGEWWNKVADATPLRTAIAREGLTAWLAELEKQPHCR